MTTAKKPARVKRAGAKTKTPETGINTKLEEPITLNFNDPKTVAKIKAYITLKEADLEIPEELALEVETLIAVERKQAETRIVENKKAESEEEKAVEKQNKEGPTYVRNGYPSEQSIRLERQEEGKKKIKLSPRGQRGDMFPLQKNDVEDPAIRDGLRRGLIELVGSGDAQRIMARQTDNMQKTQQIHIATLRNEKGEAYDPKNVKLEIEYSKQGVVVAVDDPNKGEQHENVKWSGRGGADGGLIRLNSGEKAEQVAQFIPTGGNQAIISDGYASNESLAAADAVARQKGAEGPMAGLGGLSVTVQPVKRS